MSAAASQVRRARRVGRGAWVGLVVVGVSVVLVSVWMGPRAHAEHGRLVETFDVPSSRWLGLSGMTAQVRGSLGFEEDCPVLVPEEVGSGILVFPWAVGVRYADGTRAVVHRLTGGVYAVEGEPLDTAGGWDEPRPDSDWQPACDGNQQQANINVTSWP